MPTRILFFIASVAVSIITYGQQTTTLKKSLELTIPQTGGANGAGVAWHPGEKKYYTSMAGNAGFPFAVFDSKGNRLSTGDQQALEDIRGIWYNGTAKAIQANCYADHGWVEYILDKDGSPADIKHILEDMAQPGDQNAGAYDPENNWVIFLDEMGYVAAYAFPMGEHVKEFPLHLGKTSGGGNNDDNEALVNDYNSTNIIYTGIKKAEFGVLNTKERRIELYDISTGYLTRILKLPADAPVVNRLNFSYTNGMVFLFDQTNRVWQGYK